MLCLDFFFMCMVVWDVHVGQRSASLLAFHLFFFFEIGSLIKPGVSDLSRLAGQ